eukprot:1162236-Amphidinium_carterae.1
MEDRPVCGAIDPHFITSRGVLFPESSIPVLAQDMTHSCSGRFSLLSKESFMAAVGLIVEASSNRAARPVLLG